MDEPVAPGVGLGLPARGPGSVASWSARIIALVIDWLVSLAVSLAFAPRAQVTTGDARWLPLVVLVVQTGVLTATSGGSFGQLLMGIRARRVDGAPLVGFGRALLRSALIALVVPAVVFDSDRRGLHDRAAGTVVVRRGSTPGTAGRAGTGRRVGTEGRVSGRR